MDRRDYKAKRKLISKALLIWEIESPKYCTNLDTYHALLQRKKDLGIRSIRPIKKSTLREYPQIPFLKIKQIEKAKEFLSRQSISELRVLINNMEYVLKYNYSYKTISNWIAEAVYLIEHAGQDKPRYQMNCSSGKVKARRNKMISGIF